MTCFHPLEAVRNGFDQVELGHGIQERVQGRPLWLPCGKCVGCRLERSRSWAIRCMHEAQMHSENSFITLTYENDPGDIPYSDFSAFIRRLRARVGSVRYFGCGEYGTETGRAHFHALIFGVAFRALSEVGKELYRSAELERLWPHGFSSVGSVSYRSAAYVARYATKSGEWVDGETGAITGAAARMSTKPGIGRPWWDKYGRETYIARDGVVLEGGKVVRLPRYYDQLVPEDDAADLEYRRYLRSLEFSRVAGPSLLSQEQVVKARLAQLRRKL